GHLLSQNRELLDGLQSTKSFPEMLNSYTERMSSNHGDSFRGAELLKFLRKHYSEDLSDCFFDTDRPFDETLAALKRLLVWFRTSFPYYYDSCLSCGNRERNAFVGYVMATAAERSHKAARTELYHCAACRAVSRFARYNAIMKVLETRRGRCGEYSVLMLRFLEALGYEARWVVDWADHVWTEARVGGRWVHVDPCEAAVDEPLLYESWGKKQTIIIAFTRQEAVDVTGRYTSDLDAAKARRELGDDEMGQLLRRASARLAAGEEKRRSG
ncbi:unnamed protein product, partial [Phaeothamnion confervicola]